MKDDEKGRFYFSFLIVIMEVSKDKEYHMEIKKTAIAGTLESSDVQVIVEPQDDDMQICIESSVMNQYGLEIQRTVNQVLERLGVTAGKVMLVDKGALDCTIKARIEAAVYRSNDLSESNIPWGEF